MLIFLVAAGCSSSDDNDDVKANSSLLVGEWKPLKFVYVCSELEEVENSTACEQTGRLTMRTNGTWTETYYYEYDDVCEYDGESSGTWKIVNDKLIITESGFGEIEISLFEVTESTLKVGQYDSELCDVADDNAHYYGEYIRVK
ncbi:lipocalin family protein [Aestuariibaculum sp. M13]|uniref:lipocalin family protein n=1 Tax=Aestuariibaculum sp. M13 TaxID=2967132 RepID=UPI002159C5F9|nr:lipocalin family protein [Aestuariibaculum sp. M13]MCR8668313.1 lipocalin family protein [Aestuariibaculum sp. M13]